MPSDKFFGELQTDFIFRQSEMLIRSTTITDIENHIERFDAMLARDARIEAIRAKHDLYRIVIKLNVGIISILCAVYAVYVQF